MSVETDIHIGTDMCTDISLSYDPWASTDIGADLGADMRHVSAHVG